MTKRVGFFLVFLAAMACALPASAARVTSFTVSPAHIVGGTTQQATATFGVEFQPGENINAPFGFGSGIHSVYVVVDDMSNWGAGYFHCFKYLPIGATSVTCQIPTQLAVTTSRTVTLQAFAVNINYREPPYNSDPGMTAELTVDPRPPLGTVRVTSNQPGATFSVSGPASYSGTVPFQQTNAPIGTYTATFAPISGFQTPLPIVRTLVTGGTVTFNGFYFPAQQPLRVRAALANGGAEPAAGVALPANARVPLGGLVRFEAVDSAGQPAGASFISNVATPAADIAPTALFPGSVLLRYTGAPANSAVFQAVHKGTVRIAVIPHNAAVPSAVLTVVVENPAQLGDTIDEVDAPVFVVAHRTGIPPQFLKAHAHKESGAKFDRLAYRYEPIGPFVGDLKAISRDQNLRTKTPYEDYRQETVADTLNQVLLVGVLRVDADRDVRARFFVACAEDGTGGRAIEPADAPTAWDIVRCNDKRLKMRWQAVAKSEGAARVAALRDDPFTAQTSLAASFGLLQMTYVTAIDAVHWKGDVDGAKNPSLLFDSDENLQRRAGSLTAGATKVTNDFTDVVGNTVIATSARLISSFRRAWDRYNRYEKGYGASVVEKVALYPPVGAVPVLGGGQ